MKSRTLILFFFFVFVSVNSLVYGQKQPVSGDLRTLIVFFDGLRPDYITQENMPNVFAFSQAGCYVKNHHSVFPTVTRVNATSYATGSYPKTHGLMGNTVYFPEVSDKKVLNTGEHADLQKINEATNGHLITAISIGEALNNAGAKMMVFSSGSTGQAFMQNHKVGGGAIINPSLFLPEEMKQRVISEIGEIPAKSKPNKAQHRWVTDALIKYGLHRDGPLVSAIWFSDPDGTAHSDGIGAATSMESIRIVDAEFGRILNSLKEKGLSDKFNIVISTDHGFVTNVGKIGLAEFLISKGLKESKTSEDVVVAEGALYVKDHDEMRIKKIVSALQQEEWVGPIFTRSEKVGELKGSVEGTLSFESIHWNHPDRAADILVDENWDDQKNDMGFAGTSFSRGVAGHGGLSPYEVNIALIAGGPSFKKSFTSDWPTSNVDLVPTILRIHNITIPADMDGRIMQELLLKGDHTSKMKPKTETIKTSTIINSVGYELNLVRTILGNYIYIDYAKVIRTKG